MTPLALAILLALHPDAPRTGDVYAVVSAVEKVIASDPLPEGWSRAQALATMLTYAWNESRFVMNAEHADSPEHVTYCAFQVAHDATLKRDPFRCARLALAIMRASVATCGDLSGYVGGLPLSFRSQVS